MKEWLTGYIPKAHPNDATTILILSEYDTEGEAQAEARRSAANDSDQQVVLRVVSATAPQVAPPLPQLYGPHHVALTSR